MQAYIISPRSKRPYLLEFPVRLVVKGALADVGSFLAALQTEERFLPCNHFELITSRPTEADIGKDGQVRVDQVLVEMECCAFFSVPGRAGNPEER